MILINIFEYWKSFFRILRLQPTNKNHLILSAISIWVQEFWDVREPNLKCHQFEILDYQYRCKANFSQTEGAGISRECEDEIAQWLQNIVKL